MKEDIIAAIATPPGRGSVGIIRVSGSSLDILLKQLVIHPAPISPRCVVLTDFYARTGELIDRGLILFFPAPHSYTGEDVIELQGHGGPAVMQLLLQRCFELGARPAEPGEFTKRAFLNNKIDLAQAESIADLIDAATVEAARCAARSLQGEFSREIDTLVAGLIELRAQVEAALDFPEEDDESILLPGRAKIKHNLEKLRTKLEEVLAASRQGSLLREGIRVVLVGQPNVGKSSLLNRLAGENLAIVTDIPGTTRDAIKQTINIHGIPLHIIDTAGLREPRDEVENIGISTTWREISKADVVLWISDATRAETRFADSEIQRKLPAGAVQIRIENKIDLMKTQPVKHTINEIIEISLSAKTGAGINLLHTAILDAAGWNQRGEEGVYMARARHLQALREAATHLMRATVHAGQADLLAEELRLSQRALLSITGEFTADDLLGEIFSRFCIGK